MSGVQTRQLALRDEARRLIPAIRWGIDTYFAGNPQAASFSAACDHVGRMVRTAAAFGVGEVLIPARYLDAALRALRQATLESGEMTRIVLNHNVDLLQSSIDAGTMSPAQQAEQRAELDLTYHALQQHLQQTIAPQHLQTAPLPDLQTTFALEAEAQVGAMATLLETLEEAAQRRPGLAALRRRAHTLLGAATMVGRPDIARILQQMEALIDRLTEEPGVGDAWPLELLFQSIDGLAVLVRRPQADDIAMQISESILALYDAAIGGRTAPPAGRDRDVDPPTTPLSALESQLDIAPAQLTVLLTRLEELAAPGHYAAESIAAATAEAEGLPQPAVLHQHLSTAATALQRQESLRLALHRHLVALQLLPFARLSNRLQRVVQTAAGDDGSGVTLTISGAQIAVDAPTLQALVHPLEHLLRRAIIIADARRLPGQPPEAQLILTVRQRVGKIVVELEDKASAAGPRAVQGAGLERVRHALAPLGGAVAVGRTPAEGPLFTITLPAALIAAPLLRLHVGQEVYALPRSAETKVERLLPGQLQEFGGQTTLNYGGTPLTAVTLSTLLGLAPTPRAAPQSYLILAGQTARAILVDDFVALGPLPIQPPGPFLGRLPLVAGMVLPADGGVLPVLDPVQLADAAQKTATAAPALAPSASSITLPAAAVPSAQLYVLVADGSLSVRYISAAMLRQAGWEPLVARDGREALALLARARQRIDIALIDLDLPDMDGFTLARTLRQQPGCGALPIIFSAVRASDVQRATVSTFDRSALLVKPYQDVTLVTLVRQIAPAPAGQSRHSGATAVLPPA